MSERFDYAGHIGPPFVRVQVWMKGEDGSDVRIDFRGRLHDIQDHVSFSNQLPSFFEKPLPITAYRETPPSIEVKATRTGWKFRRGKPEGWR